MLTDAGVTLGAARAEVVRVLGGGEPVWLAPTIDEKELTAVKGKPIQRVEVVLHYTDGRHVQATFGSSRDAVAFLEMIGRR